MTRDWIAEYDIERAANVALLEELERVRAQWNEALGLLREVLLTNALYETRMGALLAPHIEAFLDGPVKP